MAFSYQRTIHFPDTDAAGVVFFARYLSICHEAYEEALADAGVELESLLGRLGVIIPIARSEASYLRPLQCGDRLRIEVQPTRLSDNTFAIDYTLYKAGRNGEKRAAVVRTEHVCISTDSRERRSLPLSVADWLTRQTPSSEVSR
jgi:1,4-dihydroxy-2-naphthoyl-CoA hydrolase